METPALYRECSDFISDEFPELVEKSSVPFKKIYEDVTPAVAENVITSDAVLTSDDPARVKYSKVDSKLTSMQHHSIHEPYKVGKIERGVQELVGTRYLSGVPVTVFPNVTVHRPSGIPSLNDELLVGAPAADSSFQLAYLLSQYVFQSDYEGSEAPLYIDHGMLLYRLTPSNYYQWVVYTLPMLRAVDWYERRTGETVTLVGERDLVTGSYQEESLQELGYADQVTVLQQDLEIGNYVSTAGAYPYGDTEFVQPDQLQWLRRKVLDSVPNTSMKDSSSHLYITADDSEYRSVENQDELLRILPDEFTHYDVSSLSFVEQVNLFRDAEMIVGPTGVGLTNVLWGDAVSVIELSRDYAEWKYLQLAAFSGNRYGYVNCSSEIDSMRVNVAEVMDIVTRFQQQFHSSGD